MKYLGNIIALSALIALAAPAAEVPKVGDPAPAFAAKDQDGNDWKSTDHVGKDVVIVYFYPKDDSPGCTKEACGFRDRLAELTSAGVVIVGVSRDDADSHKQFAEKFHLGFPLLVDTDGKLSDEFGARAPGKPRDRRISFLIGKDGKILHVTDNRDATVHLTELRDEVSKLKS